ncbi:Glycosyltransferase family 61 protein [Rhynchospora pubera]|uniref:Glycosyltransferase family 61 protein n=1 Tax=Rhynchospora pubera TaxID=906938 RepID=A0AAV8E2F2_9POAL|nr:Glycosyltransferase family 61 protein [Rhynchospora pubera]
MKLRQVPLLFFLLLFLASCTLLFPTHFSNHIYNSTFLFCSYLKSKRIASTTRSNLHLSNTSIWCDRTDHHSDICFMSGDVRTHSPSSSISLYPPPSNQSNWVIKEERIRPYTRKWETPIMKTIDEIVLRTASRKDSFHHKCDVQHDAPALVFSAGGYTGNLFHSFNNVILPLYITSQHLNRRVVLVVCGYRNWWYRKYEKILSQISEHPIVDFSNDTRTHCFPAAIVGLRFHGTLSVNPRRLHDRKSILDFQNFLRKSYEPNNKRMEVYSKRRNHTPKLVIVSRKGTREIENERNVVQVSKKVGFDVEVLSPNETMPLKHIFDKLSKCDVVMGVHGAALTHFLFMRPGSMLIQIEPLGVADEAWQCFGEPALKMGIRYINYKVNLSESSLYKKYPISAMDTNAMESKKKGWKHTKEVYLEGQNVTLDLNRVKKVLTQAIGDLGF